MPNVLVVEDDPSLAELIAIALRREGLGVDCCASADSAIEAITSGSFDAVVLDLVLEASSGHYVVSAVRKFPAARRPRVLVITGAGTDALKTLDRSIVKSVWFKPLDLVTFAPVVRVQAERCAALKSARSAQV